MDSFPNGDGVGQEVFFVRGVYMLMLVGAYRSPLGERREVTASDFEQYGTWQSCAEVEPPTGYHLLEGTYESFDDKWPDSVLPAWYHADYKAWECDDGALTEVRRWMLIPWLPDVWRAAEEHVRNESARIRAMIAST